MAAENTIAAPRPERSTGHLVRATIASTIGTSIEWYDFFLYGSAAALVFPKLFFPKNDPLSALLISFATYFVGFAARPVGAALFGHLGDRIGRRATLIATLLIMGLATAAIAVVPGYATIGAAGGIVLTLLRVVQGIGVGGEWGGAVLLSMEWGSQRRRGLVASWPQLGVPVGLVLGNSALLASSAISGSAFLDWGWRIPFLLSLLLVVLGLYVRLRAAETPAFRRMFQERRIETQPVLQVIKQNPGEIVLSALLRISEQAPFYIFTTFALSYGTTRLGQSGDFMLAAVLAAAGLSLLTVPLSGYLSDRIGRRRVVLIGVIATGLIAFPYFRALDMAMPAVIVAAVVASLIPHDLQYGPQAALIAENFTSRLRYSGASLGYQLASIAAGGPAPLIAAALLGAFNTWVPIAVYVVVCALVSLVAVVLMPDRSRADHLVEYDVASAAVAEPASALA